MSDRIGYCVATSQSVQSDIERIGGQLERLIAERNKQVASAMSDFQADGTDEQYRSVEDRWHHASNEVLTIVRQVRATLCDNDQTAEQANKQAQTAVQNIG